MTGITPTHLALYASVEYYCERKHRNFAFDTGLRHHERPHKDVARQRRNVRRKPLRKRRSR